MTTVFQPRPLPAPVARTVHECLRAAHRQRPFSSADPRETARRVTALLADLPVVTRVYRGALDLRGIEVDHVWVALAGPAPDGEASSAETYVLDAAFPLFEESFVELLRQFVLGETTAEQLEEVALLTGLETRVFGDFPRPMRYLGEPVWSHR